MITGWLISGSDEASAMVCTPEPGMLNWIRFVMFGGGGFAFESRIAWRSEPASLSLVLVTVKVIAGLGAGVATRIAAASAIFCCGASRVKPAANSIIESQQISCAAEFDRFILR